MFYQKLGTRILTGNAGISSSRRSQYVVTLCFSADDCGDGYHFIDISLTEQQLLDLQDLIAAYFRLQDKLSEIDNESSQRKV